MNRRLDEASAVAATAAICCMAVSISFTQIFLWLALLLGGAAMALRRQAPGTVAVADRQTKNTRAPAYRLWFSEAIPLCFGAALYLFLIFSALFAGLRQEALPEVLRHAWRQEWTDIPLYLFGLLVYRHASDPVQRRWLMWGALVFAALTALSGFAGLFSEYRLARLATGHGFSPSAHNRPQHPLLTLGPLTVYRTIGLMNTRLTFAGLAMLAWPILAMGGAGVWLLRRTAARLFCTTLLLLLLLALAANGTRSALIGTMSAIALLACALFIAIWRNLSLRLPGYWRNTLAVGIVVASLGCATWLWLEGGEFAHSISLRHTDFYRPIIWRGAGQAILDHPWTGVGAGQFEATAWRWRNAYLLLHPQLLYYFQNSPAMHAHNDLLHFSAVGGISAGLAFLFLCASIAAQLPLTGLVVEQWRRAAPLLAALLGVFLAGLAQCYMLDDENVVVFWSLCALALRLRSTSSISAD